MSDEEIKRLGGLPEWKINEADKALETRISSTERYIWPPGQPDLETRMRAYIDTVVIHKHNNALQAIVNSEAKTGLQLQRIEEKGDDRHAQNTIKLDNIDQKSDRLQWWMLGMAVTAAGTLLMQFLNMHK